MSETDIRLCVNDTSIEIHLEKKKGAAIQLHSSHLIKKCDYGLKMMLSC